MSGSASRGHVPVVLAAVGVGVLLMTTAFCSKRRPSITRGSPPETGTGDEVTKRTKQMHKHMQTSSFMAKRLSTLLLIELLGRNLQ